MPEIKFRVGNESDKKQVGIFLKENIYPDEPMCEGENVEVDDSTLEVVLSCLSFGSCTLAENADGKLIGVRLAKPMGPEDIEIENLKIENPKTIMDTMYNFVHYLALEANIFERFGVDKVMHSEVLGVDKEYRGNGLGKQLYFENMKLAKDLGYTVYVCDCTSVFSTKACLKLGFEILFEMPYADYKNAEGVQMFHPKPPHDKAVVLAKVLLKTDPV